MQDSSGRWVVWFVYLLVLPAAGVAAMACYAAAVSGFSAFAVGLLTALSSLVVGSFLGFLFAIPRSLAVPGGRTEGLTGNTNLVQISDWLTKILVGLGLVELGAIVHQTNRLIDRVGPALGPQDDRFTVTLAILTLYSVSGFLLFYLGTALHLSGEFARAEQELSVLTGPAVAVETLQSKPVDVAEFIKSVSASGGTETGKDGEAVKDGEAGKDG